VRLLRGETPPTPKLINTCYSLVAPDYGISIAGVYQPANGQLMDVAEAGGVSVIDAPRSTRLLEASLANGWFNTITSETFG
jgi:sulfide dehydrogenase [flavocytochrome c] flavoprotein chain